MADFFWFPKCTIHRLIMGGIRIRGGKETSRAHENLREHHHRLDNPCNARITRRSHRRTQTQPGRRDGTGRDGGTRRKRPPLPNPGPDSGRVCLKNWLVALAVFRGTSFKAGGRFKCMSQAPSHSKDPTRPVQTVGSPTPYSSRLIICLHESVYFIQFRG